MPGGITKKKIKKVSFAGNIYSSTKSAKVKKYIEAKVIEYAESKGLTAKGAEEVKITYVSSSLCRLIISKLTTYKGALAIVEEPTRMNRSTSDSKL